MAYRGNIGYLFYKDYYGGTENNIFDPRKYRNDDTTQRSGKTIKKNDIISEENNTVFKQKNSHIEEYQPEITFLSSLKHPKSDMNGSNIYIEPLIIQYPGLLTGSGYNHETGSLGEYKLGFFFDHTTGLPVIPGSSVKGAMRSAFPSFHLSSDKKSEQKERAEFIWRIVNNNWKEDSQLSEIDYLQIFKLELQLFDGVNLDATIENWKKRNRLTTLDPSREMNIFKSDENLEYLSIYSRDIFYDAYITKPGQAGRIFGNDYITPHKHSTQPELDPFTNPTPIQFLKILPGVTFCFQFKLTDSMIDSKTITVENKKLLLKQILLALGIGAKTNVGYGQFK